MAVAAMMETIVKAVVDRFEGDKAVLLVGDGETPVAWPRSYLPQDITEGDYLAVKLSLDPETTQKAKDEAATLLRRLLEKGNG